MAQTLEEKLLIQELIQRGGMPQKIEVDRNDYFTPKQIRNMEVMVSGCRDATAKTKINKYLKDNR